MALLLPEVGASGPLVIYAAIIGQQEDGVLEKSANYSTGDFRAICAGVLPTKRLSELVRCA